MPRVARSTAPLSFLIPATLHLQPPRRSRKEAITRKLTTLLKAWEQHLSLTTPLRAAGVEQPRRNCATSIYFHQTLAGSAPGRGNFKTLIETPVTTRGDAEQREPEEEAVLGAVTAPSRQPRRTARGRSSSPKAATWVPHPAVSSPGSLAAPRHGIKLQQNQLTGYEKQHEVRASPPTFQLPLSLSA